MSLKTIIHSILHSTKGQSAVAAVKASPEGATIAEAINAASATDKTGPEKMADVLTVAQPLLVDLAGKGGRQVVEKDVETLARNVIESFLLEAEQALVEAVLKAL